MKDREDLISDLNELLERNYDAIEGYRNASEDVKQAELKSFFSDYVAQRSSFGQEIQREIISLGGKPKSKGSAVGGLHRTWMDIKTALSSDKEEAVLEECITGEKAAVKNYESILKDHDVPASLRTVLETHKREISEALRKLKAMEDLYD